MPVLIGGNVAGNYCGSVMNTYESNSNVITLLFVTDDDITAVGFQLTAHATTKSCDDKRTNSGKIVLYVSVSPALVHAID